MDTFSPKECGICNMEFDGLEIRPKILPCSHNICGKCLDEMIKVENRCCPFCRRDFKGNSSQSFGTNFPLLDALRHIKELENFHKPRGVTKDLDEHFEVLTIVDDKSKEDLGKEKGRAPDIPSHKRYVEAAKGNDFKRDFSGQCPNTKSSGKTSPYLTDRYEDTGYRNNHASTHLKNTDFPASHQSYDSSADQRCHTELGPKPQGEPLHHRDRSESPNPRNIREPHQQRVRSESPYQRNLHEPHHQRDQSELSYQRNIHEPHHQRDRSESPYQRNIHEPHHPRDRSESPSQRNIRGPHHQRDQSESPYQRNIRGPHHLRDRSESPHQRNIHESHPQRDRSESPYQRNIRGPHHQRDRSESPYQRNMHEPHHQRDRSESPYQRNIREPHHQRDRSESPYMRNIHKPHHPRDRSESPHQRNIHEPHHQRDRSESTYMRKGSEPLHWRDSTEYQDQRNTDELPNTTDQSAVPYQQYSEGLAKLRESARSPHSTDKRILLHQRDKSQYQPIQCSSPHQKKFSCFDLLSVLIITKDFSASTEALVQNLDAKPEDINKILEDYPLVFEENDGKITFTPEIKICSHFLSVQGCQDKLSCSKLHICPNYIFSSCSDQDCILGHNIKSSHNQSILKPLLVNELSSHQLRGILSQVIPQSTSNPVRNQSRHHNSQETPKLQKGKTSMGGYLQSASHRTLWHDDYEGSSEIPEICYYSVTGKCRDEVAGCKRLHADTHFHWQVKERGVGWVNLSKPQVEALEKAYCNPNQDTAVIPALNRKACQRRIFNLFGNYRWVANFKDMSMKNGKTEVKLSLRRLSSQKNYPKYFWYFKDSNNTWVQYGKTDTRLLTSGVSNLTSDDIEREYLKDPSSTLTFHIFGTTYILDFNTMVQMNTFTNVRRAVKRRPELHDKGMSRGKSLLFFH